MLFYRLPYLLAFILPLTVFSQKIGVSYIIPDDRSKFYFSVAGTIDHSIHIWELPGIQLTYTPAKSSAHIFVLSEDMQLLEKKEIPLDPDPITFIYPPIYEFHEDFYYVSIRYKTRVDEVDYNKIRLMKIDAKGDIIANNENMELRHQPPISQATSFYAVTSKGETLFAAVAGSDSISRLISIRKTMFGDPNIVQKDYNFPKFFLSNPKITLEGDSVLWVVSLAEHESKYPTDGGERDRLFIARLDTGLQENPRQPYLAPFNAPPHNRKENYYPESIFPSDTNLIILSTGRFPGAFPNQTAAYQTTPPAFEPTTFFHRNNFGASPTIRAGRTYSYPSADNKVNRSLRITLASPSFAVLLDTIIDAHAHGSSLELENLFTCYTDAGIELFYSQEFGYGGWGIRYFSIDRQANIREKDLVIDPHYHFLMPSSLRISPTILIVPFTYRGKIGFQKLYLRTD